jgi:predicted ATPase
LTPDQSPVTALAAWAGPPDERPRTRRAGAGTDARSPFHTALFDEPQAAIAAAMLLKALPHGGSGKTVRVGIAVDEANAALAEASALAEHAPAGSVVMTGGALERLGRSLPDGTVVRAEVLQSHGRQVTAFALRDAAEVTPHSLPSPPTRLIGREAQIRRLRDLLERDRLISLVGPPGSGKTRLAVELGRAALGTFADGAWFVPLAPIDDPDLIAHATARTLGLKEDTTPQPEVVGRHMAGRELLLILDNFEHLLDGAPVVQEWMAAAPRLRIVVTSRAPLHLTGEHEFGVPPLGLPIDPDDPAAADSDAVRLFTERATAAAPDFEPDDETLPAVARICRRLDGLPLALELAAARTKVLPVAAILGRLEQSLELLTHDARDVPERHRSLHAAVSWSFGLLSPDERAFLRRLSVFRGGWSLEAADAVTQASAALGSDPLELTTSLVDESLIRRQVEARTEPRYEMLQTLREFAGQQLRESGESDATAERHAQWYLELAERAAPLVTGAERGVWLDLLERDQNNFRAALRWAIDAGRAELGLRMAAALWRFWQIRAHLAEGRQMLDRLLALDADVEPVIRARALAAAGSLAYWQNDAPAAVRMYEASLGLRRSIGEPAELASALYDLGHVLSVMDQAKDSARGRALEEEALALYRSLGDRLGEAWLIWALGCNSHFGGDSATGIGELARSIELFRELDHPFGLAWGLTIHGLAAAVIGRPDLAEASWREALPIFASVDDVSGIDSVLEHLARLEMAHGDPRRAVRLAGAAARVRGVSESAIVDVAYLGVSALDAVRLTGAEMDAVRREGEAMTTEEAVAYALESRVAMGPSLKVHALGPMKVERRGKPIVHWGGDKAGSRQAQAIFAFLFDRGEAGITKEEATELVWPELPIRRGDLAFHRTLGGLRSVLGEGRDGDAITYQDGRYRLSDGLIGWSDVRTFERVIEEFAGDPGPVATERLEEACRLYRGDLFDDCPVYGDSSFVDTRRAYLRGRYEDLLVELGDRHRRAGDGPLAAARYRQALVANPLNERARAGLSVLGAAVAVAAD